VIEMITSIPVTNPRIVNWCPSTKTWRRFPSGKRRTNGCGSHVGYIISIQACDKEKVSVAFLLLFVRENNRW